MSYSSDLTDKEWEIIEPLLPTKKKTRPPLWTKRQILNGILYQLKNGCNPHSADTKANLGIKNLEIIKPEKIA